MYCHAHKTATLTPIQYTVCVGRGWGCNYPPLAPSVPTVLLTARLKVGWNAPLSFDLTLVPIEIQSVSRPLLAYTLLWLGGLWHKKYINLCIAFFLFFFHLFVVRLLLLFYKMQSNLGLVVIIHYLAVHYMILKLYMRYILLYNQIPFNLFGVIICGGICVSILIIQNIFTKLSEKKVKAQKGNEYIFFLFRNEIEL